MKENSTNKVKLGKMKDIRDYIQQYLSWDWQNESVKKAMLLLVI